MRSVALLPIALRPVRPACFEQNSRHDVAEFSSVMQTACELLARFLKSARTVDRASLDALRPQPDSVQTEDYYEISIPGKKLTASAPGRIPTAVRYARASRGVEGSRKKELLAENRGLLRRRRHHSGAEIRGRLTAA